MLYYLVFAGIKANYIRQEAGKHTTIGTHTRTQTLVPQREKETLSWTYQKAHPCIDKLEAPIVA